MTHHSSGRLHWDTTHLATPAWMLFLDGLRGTAPTMRPGFGTSQPREAIPPRAMLSGQPPHL